MLCQNATLRPYLQQTSRCERSCQSLEAQSQSTCQACCRGLQVGSWQDQALLNNSRLFPGIPSALFFLWLAAADLSVLTVFSFQNVLLPLYTGSCEFSGHHCFQRQLRCHCHMQCRHWVCSGVFCWRHCLTSCLRTLGLAWRAGLAATSRGRALVPRCTTTSLQDCVQSATDFLLPSHMLSSGLQDGGTVHHE